MSIILALENELHKRIRYSIASSATVIRLAEDFTRSGLVTENVNIQVRFVSSNMTNPSKGANISVVRSKTLTFEVIIIYKNSQRHGHSFALAMLDSISCQVTGFIPDIKPSVGANSLTIPGYQTGFELITETFTELTEASQYIYTQTYNIEILQPSGATNAYPCPVIYDKTELIDCLPCKRCLKTREGNFIGVAEWKNPGTDETVFVFDSQLCPLRPGDKLDVELGLEIEPKTYEVEIIYTPMEAITFDPTEGSVIDESQQIKSSFSPYFTSPDGTLPSFCRDFTVILDVYADYPGKVNEDGNKILKRIDSSTLSF